MSGSVLSDWKYSVSTQLQKYLYRKGKVKTFSYDVSSMGQTFVLDVTPDPSFYNMTSQQAGVQSGDFVQINHLDRMATYQIKEIEYYAEPSDMWMAKLLKISAD